MANAAKQEELLQLYRSKRARQGSYVPVRYAGRKAAANDRCAAVYCKPGTAHETDDGKHIAACKASSPRTAGAASLQAIWNA